MDEMDEMDEIDEAATKFSQLIFYFWVKRSG
jgi:hypothetical protein